MTIANDAYRPSRFALPAFLRADLAPKPGRLIAACRTAGICTLVVVIAMLYQIPLPAYMAYLVFLVSRGEAAATVITGVGGILAATLAIGLSFLFYLIDAGEPALRLPLMALSAFLGLFLSRTTTLGPIVFLAGFVLVLSQTLIDVIPNLEALTHLLLWLWLVVTIPAVITVTANLLFGVNPGKAARQSTVEILAALAQALRSGDLSLLARQNEAVVNLIELRHDAGLFDHGLRMNAALDASLIDALAALLTIAPLLPANTPPETRLVLAQACDACVGIFKGKTGVRFPTTLMPDAAPAVAAMSEILQRLGRGIAARISADEKPPAKEKKSILVADAFSNPGYARFALKATIAIMASYLIYSGLDWPGISTAITTCFFVALGTLGETVHKLTLRLAGALAGGLLGGICIVWLVPALSDIGQLSLLIFAVSFVGAWIASSSELLSYAGMQFAFAFFLTVLHGYAPTDDLTAPRDRVVGILLGNILMSVVFASLWPVSARDRARAAAAAVLRTLSGLLQGKAIGTNNAVAIRRALGEARRLSGIAIFEKPLSPGKLFPGRSLSALDRLAGAALIVAEQEPAGQSNDRFSHWFLAAADRLEGKIISASPPEDDAPMASIADARRLLQMEIRNAAGYLA